MMPGQLATMSRSNTRSGTGRRKPAGVALGPVVLNAGARQRGSRKKPQVKRHDPVDEPDVMDDVLMDIDIILERQAAHDANDAANSGIARRRIEMLREAQWLQSQLADCFDS
jgi:hypothetical protein